MERLLDYQVDNLGVSHYLVRLNAGKYSTAVGESHVICMKHALVINIW